MKRQPQGSETPFLNLTGGNPLAARAVAGVVAVEVVVGAAVAAAAAAGAAVAAGSPVREFREILVRRCGRRLRGLRKSSA